MKCPNRTMRTALAGFVAASLLGLGGCVYYPVHGGVVYDGANGNAVVDYDDSGVGYVAPAYYGYGYYDPFWYGPSWYGYGWPGYGFGFYGSYWGGHRYHGPWHGGGYHGGYQGGYRGGRSSWSGSAPVSHSMGGPGRGGRRH